MSFARRLGSSLPVSLLVSLGLLAFGVGEREARAEGGTGAVACPASQGSLSLLGCSLLQKLGPASLGASVSVIELKSDRELPTPAALRERIASAVTLALRPANPSGAEAKAAPGKLRVELSVAKVGGSLRVTADLRRSSSFWQRARHAEAPAEQHAFVEVALDAELRALIPPPPLVVSEVLKLKAPERGIVALSCGPLGEDGGQELAIVTRSSVRVGRIERRAFAERKKVAWATLSPVAPAPLREPIGSADITPAGTLRVGLSDRRDGLELSAELAVTQRFEALLPVPGGACVERSGSGFLGEQVPCSSGAHARVRSLPVLVDAVVGPEAAWVGREPTGGLVGPRAELAHAARKVGAQLAFGDLDGDGAPELAFAEDTLEPSDERLSLVTLEGNTQRARFDLAVASANAGISAIALCQRREGPGMAPVVLATGDELWLLR